MRRVAAIDCGTNSIRLLVADTDAGGRLVDVEREMTIVRLGHGVDRTGRFDEEALARTLAATHDYAERIRAHGVPFDSDHVRFVATSATRDAENRDVFLGGVEEILGVRPGVITGTEEAALSFRGAVSVLDPGPVQRGLVVDLGGGSTELVLGRTQPDASVSMNIGCVRLTERHVRSDPATAAELTAIRADAEAALDEASGRVGVGEASVVIGVAGTITTVTAHALGLDRYDPQAIHGARLPIDAVVAAAN
ncbi:MAG TPA: exopolyphosphatase, partial [Terrimesophilobacter sp.]|nr:exopolyphosphatase [Terrimesophilobacter sp.]